MNRRLSSSSIPFTTSAVSACRTGPYAYAWSNGATTQDVQFLSAGTYTVTVTDANTCTANQTLAVNQPTSITAVASHTNSTCSNPNGTATVTVSGGVTPYTFLWSTGQTTQSIAGLSMGSYTVTITDANGCIKTRITILADEPPPVIFLDSVHHVSCFGLSNGAIYIHKAGGAPPVTYLWSVGLTQQDLVNVVAGTYTVTVTDQNGCTDTLTQTLTQPPVLSVTVSTAASTCGAANGGAAAMPSGGTPPYTYLWSNAQTGLSVSGIAAGTYTVTVTDSLLCTAAGSGMVTDMAGPALVLDSVHPVSCNGLSDGAVYISANGGTAPFSYAWSGGATTQDLVGVAAGTYTVTVTDNNGCTATLSAMVSQPAVLTVTATLSIASCGLSNGGVTANPAGGTAPYAYAWNAGQTTQSVAGLAAGTYTVTVTDVRGCTASKSATVVNAPGPSLSLDSTVAAACFGGNTGAAYVSVSSGSPPLTYAWTGGAMTQDLLAVAAGTYTLVVTDTNGCTDTLSATIGQPSQLNDSLTTNSTVCGGSSGSVQVWPYGGTAPYGYLWSTGSTAQFIVGLAAGPYTVTVTDANGCTFVNSAVVSNIGGAIITLDSIVPVKCNGQSNGAVYVTVSSGTPPYVFQWNPGPATEDIVNVPAGSYTLIVQDNNGCFSSKTYVVPQPDTLKVTVQTTNALCGGSNGSANANPTGGTSPYGYLWSTTATTQGIVNVTSGSYTVTVTDSKGCTKAVSATVGNTPAPAVSLDSIVQVKCNGEATGGVYISVSGAAPPFSYAWSTGATTQDLGGVGAGTYTVTVTDANNCTKTVSYSVNQPQPLSQTVSTTPSTCGAANGTATSLASGGVSPYGYLWAPGGQTTASISNLAPGSYTVTVTDANSCTKTGMGVVGSTNNPVVVFDSVLQVSCNGAGNGAIYVSISGGQGPFAYNWTPGGATTQDITGLQPNCYHLIVIDANNCITQADTCITQPAVLSDSLQKMHETCGNMNGTATVFPYGGTAPYSYTWSTGATTQSVSGLAAGNYTATITDVNGCTRVHIIAIQNQAGPVIVTDSVMAVRCFGESNGGVLISVSGGTTPFSYAWSPGGQTGQDLSGVGAGTYTVTVTDGNGCTAVQSFTVTQPPVLADSIQTVTATCGNGNGSAAVFVYGGVQPYSYIWSSGSVSDTIQNKPAGSYVVTVTDANGCTVVDTAAIGNVGGPLVILDTIVMPSCTGSGNGSILITVVAGASPFSYQWSNGAMTKDNLNIPAGTYTVTVTDSAGCSVAMSWPVADPPPVGDSLQVVQATCGLGNGSMTVFPFGGTGTFTYLWSTGATTQTISNLAPGVYSVTVTDGKGCANLDFATVNNLASPVATIATVDSVQCNGGADGNITLSVNGGTPPLSYLWSTGATTLSLTAVPAGMYTVTVTDANGCTDQADTLVAQPDSLVIVFGTMPALCNDSNGCATALPAGGTGNYQYLWSTGDTSAMACGLYPGSYAVTVSDAHGCLRTDSVNVPNVGGPTVVVDSVLAVACHGDSTGAVLVIVTGGAGAYQYAWSQGATSQNVSGLPAGVYTLTVTDSAGCATTISQAVAEPAVVLFNGLTTPSNCDTATGTVSVTPSGGTPGYAVLWSTGATTQSVAGLAAGSYAVTVTDGNQCQTDTVLVVSNPPSPVIDTAQVTDVTCHGGMNGYINISVSGGTLPYSFLWSDFTTNEDLINSPAGVYTVTVTDGSNCTATGSYTILEPTAIVIQFAITDAACGDSTGQVIATVSGGTGPYSLMWSTGDVSDTLSGLPAGSYTLTVTDSNNCKAMQIANVSNLSAPVIQVVDSAMASCYGALDGYVVVSVSGGTPPYAYSWTNTLQTGDSIYNLAGGMTYTLTVTDANNCKSIRSVYVDEPDSIAVTGVVPQVNGIYHVSCFGGDDGSINITPSGGTPPYAFAWSNFAQTEDLTNLPADTFTVIVTDANGCKKSQSFVLLEPPPVVADAGSNFILCGLNYDTLHAVVPAYGTGHWELKSGFGVIADPNAPVTAVTGLGFGNNVFVWIVSDGVSKCNDSSEVIVSVQSAIIAIAGTDRSVCADSVVLTATPPQFGYGYWQVVSGTGAVKDTAKAKTLVTGLSAGTSVFRWTVINGLCSDDAEVRITRLDPSECLEDIHMPTGITPNGDGKNDVFVIRGLDDYADNTIMIYNRWGNKVFEQSPYLNNWKGTNQHGDLLQEGTYFVILRIGGIEKAFTGYIDLRR